MITIAEFHTIEQLSPLAGVWKRLCDRTPEPCLSQSLDWINSLELGNHTKLRVLLGVLGGRPFGILPLKVETRFTEVGPLRFLTGIGEPEFRFAGPIGPHTTAMLTAGFRHLSRTRRDWDLIELHQANPTETQHRRLQNAFRLMSWRCDVQCSELPISERATNASPSGFRYTHVRTWALRARWLHFRRRIRSSWQRDDVPAGPGVPEPQPEPIRLKLYSPQPHFPFAKPAPADSHENRARHGSCRF